MADPQIGPVSSETKGVLLAFVSLGAGEGEFAALGEPCRQACLCAWRALGRLSADERAQVLGQWRIEAAHGLPGGIEHLHPSWITDAFADEPPYLLAHLLAHLGQVLPPALRPTVEMLRSTATAAPESTSQAVGLAGVASVAFADLAPLCEGEAGPIATRLCALPLQALEDEVTRLGARTLGYSLAGTDAAARARVLALAGDPWARLIGDALRESASDEVRRAAALHVATNVEASACTTAERLLFIGLAALRQELLAENPGSVFRVAGRLPIELGRRLLARPSDSPPG